MANPDWTDPGDWEDATDEEEDLFEVAVMNCSMGPDGYCGQAGSEYCEFDCPFRRN